MERNKIPLETVTQSEITSSVYANSTDTQTGENDEDEIDYRFLLSLGVIFVIVTFFIGIMILIIVSLSMYQKDMNESHANDTIVKNDTEFDSTLTG